MYGIQPSKKWHSLSILSVGSHHSELLETSRDTAYRNAIRVELGKAHNRTNRHLRSVMDIVEFAGENSSLAIPIEVLRAEFRETVAKLQKVIDDAGALHTERLLEEAQELRVSRKSLVTRMKQIRKEILEGMCQYAPVNFVIVRSSWADGFDAIATWLAPVWLTLLGISALILLFACARSYKRD
jgi:hypothetical protein